MRNYIIKRVAQSVLILFCVMFIIYALIRSLPSSFAETMAMQLAQAPGAKPYEEWLAQLNASYGLDLDIVPGFFTWLIRTARAKGLSEHTVIYKHAFRNTLIPLVTIIGGSLPGLFSGALITETLFSIPGIGYISYQSMVAGDIPFTMFYLSFMAVLTLASNLLTDILYGVVDPRVRIS